MFKIYPDLQLHFGRDHVLPGGTAVSWWGGPKFFGVGTGGDQFFSVCQRGGGQNFLRVTEGGTEFFPQDFTRIFFTHAKGGPKKIGEP